MENLKLTPEKLSMFSKIVHGVKKNIELSHKEYVKVPQNQMESICKRFLGEWLIANK